MAFFWYCPTDSIVVLEVGKESEPFRFRLRVIDDCSHDCDFLIAIYFVIIFVDTKVLQSLKHCV